MKKIELYDYQQRMVEDIIKMLTTKVVSRYRRTKGYMEGNSVIVQMPTGTGKTYVMASVVKWFLDNYLKGEVWIVAHRRELVEQMQLTLDRFCLEYGEKEMALEAKVRIRVLSIQWLGRHMEELEQAECVPGLIVVDEAHHALASSYKVLFERNRNALKLGMTATPCRMKKESFGLLFERLLLSPSTKDFIKGGYLAPYDYVVIGQYSQDQLTIDSLKGRGSDGDYSIKEMDEKLNVPESIKRLYESMVKHADGKKGIVYAIDIDHAKMIAAYYVAKGVRAVALDSKTPAKMRERMVEAFRKGELDCLVNVNLFDEGFDCPDVEYIQMARPTLSLAKYLQMVGRGLRVNRKQKDKVCMIIDNVGNYRKFGLPDRERNWKAMYAGVRAGKGSVSVFAKKPNSVVVPSNDMVFVAQYDKRREVQSGKRRYEYLQDVKPFEVSGRWGLRVDDDIILQPVYRRIYDFVGGFAIFEIAPNRVGILIRNGRVYYPPNYREIKLLSGNRALLTQSVINTKEVKLDTKWGY